MHIVLNNICLLATSGFASIAPVALLLSALSATAIAELEQVPLIGTEGPAEDACVGIATIVTLDPHVAVRERPDQYASQKDKLAPATLVWLCERDAGENGEEWQGIVYPSGEFQKLGDCRVSAPVAAPEPYSGPCRSGWVMARGLRLVAG